MGYDPAQDHEPLIPASAIPAQGGGDEVRRKRYDRSVAFGGCPDCTSDRVGLVRSGTHLVYREHYRATFGAARILCRATGSTICDNPPRGTEGQAATCTHWKRGD